MCKQITWIHYHDDVIKWKHFPRCWPLVRGIHRWPVNSPHKGQWRWALMFSLICASINDKRLRKQSWGWQIETPSSSLWRHCNAIQNYDYTKTKHNTTVCTFYGIYSISSFMFLLLDTLVDRSEFIYIRFHPHSVWKCSYIDKWFLSVRHAKGNVVPVCESKRMRHL